MRYLIQHTVCLSLWLAFGMFPSSALAHCDTMSGPVVTDAKTAIESGQPDAVFKWVRPEDEPTIREQFKKTLAVRRLSETAAELADRYFFETVVRLHRASEGAPYTGLKESDRIEPIVQKSDQAIAEGRIDPLVEELQQAIEHGIRERFSELKEKQPHKDHNAAAGREFVRAYVEFVHYIERLHSAAILSAHAADSVSAAEREHSH